LGDVDLSVDYLRQDLSASVYTKFREIQTPVFYSRVYPDYRSHPGYQKMLRDFSLDQDAIGLLDIPALPF